MSTFIDATQQAFHLITSGDTVLFDIILLSFRVSLSALFFGLIIGLPIAIILSIYNFPGRRLLHLMVDTMMAFPPVVVGLIVYLLLSQNSPLGIFGLLYSPTAMIIAQTLLITPLIIALSLPYIRQNWLYLREQLLMLGYRPKQCFWILLYESRLGLITVTLASFGRAIAEIGAVMIVGGNIGNHTRVMTTAIAMETQQGNLVLALALGIILILTALLLNTLVHFFKHHLTRKQTS
jgi:tungstate transport system permease protein